MLLKIGHWEARRKYHVYKDDVESTDAEYCIVKEGAKLSSVDSLVERVPFLSKLWLS